MFSAVFYCWHKDVLILLASNCYKKAPRASSLGLGGAEANLMMASNTPVKSSMQPAGTEILEISGYQASEKETNSSDEYNGLSAQLVFYVGPHNRNVELEIELPESLNRDQELETKHTIVSFPRQNSTPVRRSMQSTGTEILEISEQRASEKRANDVYNAQLVFYIGPHNRDVELEIEVPDALNRDQELEPQHTIVSFPRKESKNREWLQCEAESLANMHCSEDIELEHHFVSESQENATSQLESNLTNRFVVSEQHLQQTCQETINM